MLTNGFQGFSRQGRSWFSNGSITQNLPGNSLQTPFETNFAGMRINAAFTDAQVNAVFEAMEQEHDAIILNSPELTSFSGQRANAQFIRQIAYISDYAVENDFLDPEISVLNVGDIIDVRPLVSADRKYVTLEVRPTTVVLQNVFVERLAVVIPITQRIATVASYPIELPNAESVPCARPLCCQTRARYCLVATCEVCVNVLIRGFHS